jgi:hypothetical protein
MKAWPLLLLPLAAVAIAAARADDAALPSNVVAALEAKLERAKSSSPTSLTVMAI